MAAKYAVDPRAKLAAAPLWQALEKVATERGTSVAAMLAARPAMAKRAKRLERGLGWVMWHRTARPVGEAARTHICTPT
ncbi:MULTISPECIES: hypothetical protein [Nonomuraea]|uniref:Uncharacterized protein n=1 Tax=Nonomuraea mangrovi TaxID=2316207 RepID=A0ABW4TDD5_9ACTN